MSRGDGQPLVKLEILGFFKTDKVLLVPGTKNALVLHALNAYQVVHTICRYNTILYMLGSIVDHNSPGGSLEFSKRTTGAFDWFRNMTCNSHKRLGVRGRRNPL